MGHRDMHVYVLLVHIIIIGWMHIMDIYIMDMDMLICSDGVNWGGL